MAGLRLPELIVILLIVLLLFGAGKIPQLMKGFGQGIKEFKKGMKEDDGDSKKDEGRKEESASEAPTGVRGGGENGKRA